MPCETRPSLSHRCCTALVCSSLAVAVAVAPTQAHASEPMLGGAIMATGMVFVIVTRHIDLSVGSVAAFTGAVAAWLTVDVGLPFWLVIPLTLIVGGMIGAAQGYWVAFWRIPSFIVTLAGMMVFRGATMLLLGGQNIGPFPKAFQSMSSGFMCRPSATRAMNKS